jgi:protein-tyrosine phosphatase
VPPQPFRVLFVCTGNICRSPTAERLLRHRLAETFAEEAALVEVTSAGTGAVVGAPIQEYAAALLAGSGVDTAGFAARDLDEQQLAGSGLVLAMTREHRAAAATTYPRAIPNLFTLREFSRLAGLAAQDGWKPEGDLPERLAALVPAARAFRGAQYIQPSADDVPDPYGRAAAAYDEPYRLISEAVDTIVDVVTG